MLMKTFHTLPLTAILILVQVISLVAESVLLIGNKSDDTVTFVDAETLEVLGQTTTGRGPHELVVTPDGKWAYVANYEGPGDSLSLIDVGKRKEIRKIPLKPYFGPHGLTVSKDGSRVYVTCERTQCVVEINTGSQEVERSYPTGQKGSHMLVLSPDERQIFTANMGSGSVTAIDLEKGVIAAVIETGKECEGIDITPDGKEVWVTNRAEDTLSIIDAIKHEVLATLPCQGFPIRIKIVPGGDLALVSCARSNELAIFDVARRKLIKRISTGTTPVGILVEPDGSRAFIANTRSHKVIVVDLKSLEIIGSISAGNTPDGLALATGD